MQDTLKIATLQNIPLDIKGKYNIQLFDAQGQKVQDVEVTNTVFYEASDSALNFIKFLLEYGTSSTSGGSSRPIIRQNSIGSAYPTTIQLLEQKVSKDCKYFLPSFITGMAWLGSVPGTNTEFIGAYNAPESSATISDGYLVCKDVYEFSTRQANGTINAVCMQKVINGYPTGSDRTQETSAPFSYGYGFTTNTLTRLGPAKLNPSDATDSNPLYGATYNTKGQLVLPATGVVVINPEAYLSGLAQLQTRPAKASEMVFPGMLMEDPSKACLIGQIRDDSNYNTIIQCKILNAATGLEENTKTLDLFDASTKLQKYLKAKTNSNAYLYRIKHAFCCHGYWGATFEYTGSGNPFPKLRSDGTYTENATNTAYAACIYDFNKDCWVVEPDFLSVDSAGYYGTSSGYLQVPKLFLNIGGQAQYSATLKPDLASNSSWLAMTATGNAQMHNEASNRVIAYRPRNQGYIYTVGLDSKKFARCRMSLSTTDGSSYAYAPGAIHPNGTIMSGYYFGDKLIPYKSLVHLDSPIVKTAEHTMKVTYTLSIKIPNIFAQPGHEYEFDIDASTV